MALWVMLIPLGGLAGVGTSKTFEQQVGKIADFLNYKDGRRAVEVAGHLGQSVELMRTHWELKSPEQSVGLSSSMQADAMKLPEAERLEKMNRVDDWIQIWAVPLPAAGPTPDERRLPPAGDVPMPDQIRSRLTPTKSPHEYHREILYLGQDAKLAWFGYMPIPEYVALSRSLPFRGEDTIDALIRGIAIHDLGDHTTNACAYELGAAGLAALPKIERAIRDRSPERAVLVQAMAGSDDEQVVRWLIAQTASVDAEVAGAARDALLARLRPAAGELYLKWLAEDAGKASVTSELHYCRELKMRAAGPLVTRVLERPTSVYEYRLALEFSRELAGQPPLPPVMIRAEQDIHRYAGATGGPDQKGIDRAIEVIVTANDPQAAAAIGLSMSVFYAKGNVAAVREAGPQILQRLPGQEAKRLAELLAQTDQAISEREDVKAIGQSLGAR